MLSGIQIAQLKRYYGTVGLFRNLSLLVSLLPAGDSSCLSLTTSSQAAGLSWS